MISIIWEFLIDPTKRLAFEKAYSREGTWVQLFQQSSEYFGTTLLKDKANPNKYITIDRWHELNSFEQFKIKFAKSYAELDQRCEEMTLSEKRIGIFEEI